jgi:UDP-N-acetylglucosamine 2-epimerase (non-hydrolysing)
MLRNERRHRMEKLRVLSVFGTRPEAIKMAPLVKHLAALPEFESLCCLTGQHRQMLDSVMEIFRLRADFDLNIMQANQTLSSITSRTLLGMENVIETAKPDLILVHGDTSTTFAGALAAFYHKIPVGHVEAGLRTWDKYSPFPEEMNRTLVSDIAALHFCPTENNLRNLEREGVAGSKFITGNTVIDAMKTTVRPDFVFSGFMAHERAPGSRISGLRTARPERRAPWRDSSGAAGRSGIRSGSRVPRVRSGRSPP